VVSWRNANWSGVVNEGVDSAASKSNEGARETQPGVNTSKIDPGSAERHPL
jgi:hypothetical protein